MVKMTQQQLFNITVCPVCKEKRRQGEMMLGTDKPICEYCYRGKERNKDVRVSNSKRG